MYGIIFARLLAAFRKFLMKRRANESEPGSKLFRSLATAISNLEPAFTTSARILPFIICNVQSKTKVERNESVVQGSELCRTCACVPCLVAGAAERRAKRWNKPKRDRYRGAVRLFVTSRERVGRRRCSRNRMCRVVFKISLCANIFAEAEKTVKRVDLNSVRSHSRGSVRMRLSLNSYAPATLCKRCLPLRMRAIS